jgi:hypothetical protein
LTLAALAAAVLGPSAHAQTAEIQFLALDSRFANPVGGGATVEILPTGGSFSDPASIRWSTPIDDGKSGYDFDARGTPFVETPFTPFLLGDFTHLNRPIFEPVITATQLLVSAEIGALTGGSGPYTPLGDDGNFLFTFDIFHNETPNNGDPCDSSVPDRSDPVNVNGCADEVTFAVNPFSESFTIDGEILTLNITGFTDGDGNFSESFLSKELGDNLRFLTAEFTTFPTPPVEEVIPLPAGVALLPLGLAGIAALRARRRRGEDA